MVFWKFPRAELYATERKFVEEFEENMRKMSANPVYAFNDAIRENTSRHTIPARDCSVVGFFSVVENSHNGNIKECP
ncbi:hypothetical protein T02_16154 [Trichinella nativa]|uniref:Uncharacterized protein n=1 Tax=Trichinella nativa TaxID=6335 RepID=A0A0V1L859_9BILA|nr:hypothetical protein T02_16154 [Trichinella nativa]